MQDILLQLSENPTSRKVIKGLGLPIPMPQPLKRAKGNLTQTLLADRDIALFVDPSSALALPIAQTLAKAGANILLPSVHESLSQVGAAWGRTPSEEPSEGKFDAMVFDGSHLSNAEELRALYDFFHSRIRRLKKGGRLIVVGRPVQEANTAEAAGAQAALEGFVRSCAKELGKKGICANLIRVSVGVEALVEGPLSFLLSDRAAYITAQPLVVSGAAGDDALQSYPKPLEGKLALVTGAARGIGAQCARRLAAEGAIVVCLDRADDSGDLEAIVEEIDGVKREGDVTSEADTAALCSWADERGGFDIIVHNAGVTRDKTLGRMSEAQWDLALNVNLSAIEKMTAAMLDADVINPRGRIICMSSIAGVAGNMGQTNYAASKAGVMGYTQRLAEDLAEQEITINAIAPGFIETQMTAAIPAAIREVARRFNLLSQGGKPEDIAQAVLFFASPASQGVSGQTLRVCGGSLIGR